jgi:hypothetical protein
VDVPPTAGGMSTSRWWHVKPALGGASN